MRRSRFVVDAPAALALRVREENLTFARRTDRVNTPAGPRVVHTWATGDVPRLKPEPYAADSTGVYQAVYVAAPVTWQGIGAWYAGNARGRYALGPAASAKLAEVLAPARTRDDSVRAVQAQVARELEREPVRRFPIDAAKGRGRVWRGPSCGYSSRPGGTRSSRRPSRRTGRSAATRPSTRRRAACPA